MSTKGSNQGRGGLQKGRPRWYNNKSRAVKSQDGVDLPKKPPKRPQASASPPDHSGSARTAPRPGAGQKRRKQDLPKPRHPEPRREVLNQPIVAAPPFHYVAQVGQGTYGKVYKAVDTTTNRIFAMKRLRMESQREGLPVTAAREIKLLQMLQHKNIVRLNEIVVARTDIYMAFDYIEHDLAGLLLNAKLPLSPANIKSVIHQTTAALAFLHSRMIMHRDIKGSNILVTADGVVKLADFGLARYVEVVHPAVRYTNRVITLWYRPPELLLGADRYGPEVDEWGVGCLLVELIIRSPLFHGKDEISQLQAIYEILGAPSMEDWPEHVQLPWYALFEGLPIVAPSHPRTLASLFDTIPVTPACLDIITRLLAMNPSKRLRADEALDHTYFKEEPKAEPLNLALVDEWHDWEAKQRTRGKSAGADGQQPSECRPQSQSSGDLPSRPQPSAQGHALEHQQPQSGAQRRPAQTPERSHQRSAQPQQKQRQPQQKQQQEQRQQKQKQKQRQQQKQQQQQRQQQQSARQPPQQQSRRPNVHDSRKKN